MHNVLKGAIIVALCATSPIVTFAQSESAPPADQEIKTLLGELSFANALLLRQVKNLSAENAKALIALKSLSEENAKLKAQLDELSKKIAPAPDKQGN